MENVLELELLAALLAMPDEESQEVLAEIAATVPWMQPALAELAETPLETWQVEHTRLFISGHPRTFCPPFESAWREGRMQGHALDKVGSLYARAGFTPLAALPADYLGSELEWLASLLATAAVDEALVAESVEHLCGWVPKFASALQQDSQMELYRALGQKLEGLFA